jgi:2-polyprenyl-6-methoxyphenol hydroxylase-like FAD-dependent oxidoreductase
MPGKRHAEIAGAGIAGLTAACVLARRGWSVRVHEQSQTLREIGAGIYLKENSLRVLREIGVFDRISSLGVRLREGQIRDERDRVLVRRVLEKETCYTTLRGDLHRALADQAEASGVEIVTSSGVDRADPDGTLHLSSGKALKADLVIGADGHRSRIRDSVGLTARVGALRDGATRLLIPRTEADGDGISKENWSGDCRLGIVPCSPRDVYVFLIAPEGNPTATSMPVNKDFWRSRFPRLAHVIDRISDEGGRHDPHVFVQVRGWHAGRVAILGDAAHAQPPNLGQGAGMSMANASALAAHLDENADVPSALASWQDARRGVSEQVQLWSYRYGVLGYCWPSMLTDLRSGVIWTVGHVGFTARKWGWLWRGGLDPSQAAAG